MEFSRFQNIVLMILTHIFLVVLAHLLQVRQSGTVGETLRLQFGDQED
jgi:hypothetical protein